MKKISIILAAALMMTSCKGLLDTFPKNQISDGNMWSNKALSTAGIDGLMYPLVRHESGLNNLICSDGKGGINRIGTEGLGYTSLIDAGDQTTFLRQATKIASGTENAAEWKNNYTAIMACNKAIAHLKKEIVGDELYGQYICEAKMIRAYCYSRLNMYFGEVPIYLEETDNSQCTKAQSTWDQVWKMIIDECTSCIDDPYFQTNNITGIRPCKPSKGMAYALRGNAYMWLAANKNPEIYDNHKGIDAQTIKSYYEAAAADFADVKECGFGLWDAGADHKWEELFLPANEHNCEMIFPLEHSSTDGYNSCWQWVIGTRTNLNAWTRLVPAAEFVDDFEWADGTKFKWTQIFPDWNKLTAAQRAVFFMRDSLDTFAARVKAGSTREKEITLTAQREKMLGNIGQEVWDEYYLDNGNEARLRTAYDGRDPRLDKAVVTPYKQYRLYNEDIASPKMYQLRWPRFKQENTVDDSDMWPEFSSNMVYVWYKGLVTDGSMISRGVDGTDWPIIRYTHIHLMRAEALANSGNIPEARNLLNDVRRRAGMAEVTSRDYDDVINEIRYEERVELCTEGQDFFNEIRWGTFKEKKFNNKYFTDPQSCWRQGGWKTGYYYVDGMWPLSAPLTECVMNTNLRRRAVWSY